MLSIKFLRVSLWHMNISAGVVRAIALQQIDHAPRAITRVCKVVMAEAKNRIYPNIRKFAFEKFVKE